MNYLDLNEMTSYVFFMRANKWKLVSRILIKQNLPPKVEIYVANSYNYRQRTFYKVSFTTISITGNVHSFSQVSFTTISIYKQTFEQINCTN